MSLNLDTSTPTGKLMLNLLGSISEFERALMLERQRDGIAKAKSAGRYKGRAPTALQKTQDVLAMREASATVLQTTASCELRQSCDNIEFDQRSGGIVMLKAIAAALAIFTGTAAAHAGDPKAEGKSNALRHIAQVSTIQKYCDKVEVNATNVALIARFHNIDLDRDREQLLKLVDEQSTHLSEKTEDIACAAGLALYGPSGANIPDLIKLRK